MTPPAAVLGLVPHPQTDQTISSFLLLLARNQSSTPHELCALVWPEHQFWPRDIDRTANDALIAAVARLTTVSAARLRAMTLRGLVEAMGRTPTSAGIQQGILPVGVYHRMRHLHGQQFCPDCLNLNPPYLRRTWRLEFVSACPVHQRRLLDACPACDAPLIPHRQNSLLDRRCYKCNGALVGTNPVEASARAMELQRVMLQLIGEGTADELATWATSWTTQAQSSELFDGVRRLCRLLKYCADGGDLHPRRPGLKWDFLRVNQREAVLASVSTWVSEWPNPFLSWADENCVSQERISEFGPWPAWMQVAVSQLCRRPRKKRRRSPTLLGLRAEHGNSAAYRMARAKFLLDRATVHGVSL